MNLNQIHGVMRALAPELRSLGKSLCDQEQAEFVVFAADGVPVVSTLDVTDTPAAAFKALADGCAACEKQLPDVLAACLGQRQGVAARCSDGHGLYAAPLVESKLLLGALLGRDEQDASHGSASGDSATQCAVSAAARLITRTLFLELESASLTEDLSLRYEELSILYEIGERLSLKSSPAAMISYILAKAAEAVDSACSVWVSRGGSFVTTNVNRPARGECSTLAEAAERIGLAVAQQAPAALDAEVWSNPSERLGLQDEAIPYRQALIVPVDADQRRFGWIVVLRSDDEAFVSGEVKILSSLARRSAISMQNASLYQDLNDLLLNTIKTLVFVIEGKDPYTRGHSERVNALALRIGSALRLPVDQKHLLNWASLLHDIGKLRIPERIIQKAGKLTPRELRIIQCHPAFGTELLAPIQQLADCLPAIRYHHERIDGNGYPDRLEGKAIPLAARIIAVADTWDAITSDRCYRPRFTSEEAEQIMGGARGTQLDAAIVELFLERRAELTQGIEARMDRSRLFSAFTSGTAVASTR